MSLRPEQITARQYLDQKGSRLTAAQLRDRVGAAFAAIEEALGSVEEEAARGRAIAGAWSVQEIVDHLVETHRPSIAELRDLLSGRRPEGPPIPAGLQSADPMGRRWPDLLRDLRGLHAEILGALVAVPDGYTTDARAPLIMVVNTRAADGSEKPLHWIEELDWKAYAIVFRLHVLDHLGQIKKTLGAARAGS
ncbi:MAG: hypothetical protein HYV93_05930 [Candidatus Rokubacteria bacterium]|nr:hypothetical protein [Candidatus Rokubacteria bacterium]